MIAIPNMDKPKDCSECILADKHLNGLYEAKYYCRLEADDCPLIEIVRCGDCKHYGFKETDRGGFPCCTNVIGATPYRIPTDFCSKGERRADD